MTKGQFWQQVCIRVLPPSRHVLDTKGAVVNTTVGARLSEVGMKEGSPTPAEEAQGPWEGRLGAEQEVRSCPGSSSSVPPGCSFVVPVSLCVSLFPLGTPLTLPPAWIALQRLDPLKIPVLIFSPKLSP